MDRGVDRGRAFFSDSSSVLKLTRYFEFRENWNSISPSSFPKIQLERSIDFEEYTHPALAAHPLNILVSEVFWTFGPTWSHIWTQNLRREVIPPLFPPAPTSPSPTPLISHILRYYFPETVFLNVCRAQELPRNEFRQPM